MDSARIDDLPAELLFHITEQLLEAWAFGSVVSFALCNRRLRGVLPLLYRNVGRTNSDVGENALIWATENAEFETLEALLKSGVDPNARFWSCLPDCARQDVFAAQRVRPRLSPRLDGHFIAKLLQQDIVRYQRFKPDPWGYSGTNGLFREWYLATVNGDMPEALDVGNDVDGIARNAHFGCRLRNPSVQVNISNTEGPLDLYFWSALHLATKQGNDRAVKLLIAHGADVESRCRGLCDCITPEYWEGRWQPPPSFSALHIAVCSGHQHLARVFLARGADLLTAGRMAITGQLPMAALNRITVFHTAALQGNIPMCQFLFDHHVASGPEDPTRVLEYQDPRGLSALDYAVAAGHMRTTGNWLLNKWVTPRHYYDYPGRRPASLNFLCFFGKYGDAQYILDSMWPPPETCTLAMQSCFVRLRSSLMPVVSTLGSLRAYIDEYMAVCVSEESRFVQPDSEEALAFLIRKLLDLSANPTATLNPVLTLEFPEGAGKTPLHLAASYGQREVLRVLLDAGAPVESYVDFSAAPHGVGLATNTPLTPLGCAMVPPPYSLAHNDPQVYLETIIFLLGRGASVRNSMTRYPEDNFGGGLFPLFSANFGGAPWYNLDHFDLFERVMELVAKDLGQERFPTAWLTDLMYMAVTCGTPNGNFCKWLVQRYGVAFTDFSHRSLTRVSPANLIDTGRYKPGMMEFLLDFMRDTAPVRKLYENSLHAAAFYAYHGFFIPLRALVDRTLVFTRRGDATPEDEESEERSTQLNQLRGQSGNLIMEASKRCTQEGSLELIRAVLAQLPKIGLGDHPEGLLHTFHEHAISWVVSQHRLSYETASHTPGIKLILQELLRQESPLYGVAGRHHGKHPLLPRDCWSYRIHPFVYPIPVAVDMGRWDLLEVILTKSAPPQPGDILETLAMALDTTFREADPAIIRVILQHSPVDVRALISRPSTRAETRNGVTSQVPPLYYLLKTFVNAHVIPWNATVQLHGRPTHECDCVIITKDRYLVECVGLLVKHGASWTQPSLPSGETPLDVLAAILDGKGCRDMRAGCCSDLDGMWPTHNWNTLRRHVKLDWRAANVAGRELGDGFNPVEVARLGVEATWGRTS